MMQRSGIYTQVSKFIYFFLNAMIRSTPAYSRKKRGTGKMSFFKSIMSILLQISRDQANHTANLQSAGTKKQIADTETEDGWIQRLLNYWKTSSKNMIQ